MAQTIEQHLRDHLIAYFPLDGDLADPFVAGQALSPENTTFLSYTPRWGGNVCLRVRSMTMITMPRLNFVTPPNTPYDFALSLWFNCGIDFPYHTSLFSCSAFEVHPYSYQNQNFLRFTFTWGGATSTVSVPLPALNRWHHLCLSFHVDPLSNLTQVQIWFDGASANSSNFAYIPAPPFQKPETTFFMPASYCMLSVFDKGLSDTEALYLASDLFNPEHLLSGSRVDFCALSLNSGAIAVADNPLFEPFSTPSGMTISSWLCTSSLDVLVHNEVFLFRREPECYAFGVDVSLRLFGRLYLESGPVTVYSEKPLSAYPAWIYVSYTLTPNAISLFIDGLPVGTTLITGTIKFYPYSHTVTLASQWPNPLYSVELYQLAMTAAQITAAMNAASVQSDPTLQNQLLVYYDLSTLPLTVTSPHTDLEVTPQLPAGALFHQYSRAASFIHNAYFDCGSDGRSNLFVSPERLPKTLLSSQNSSTEEREEDPASIAVDEDEMLFTLSVTAWILPLIGSGNEERHTIASRSDETGGFQFYLQNDCVGIEVLHDKRKAGCTSSLPMPAGNWCQAGFTLTLWKTQDGHMTTFVVQYEVFLNGRSQAQYIQLLFHPPSPHIFDQNTPFTIGALVSPDPGTGIIGARDGFYGFIQRASLYSGVVDMRALYFGETDASFASADYFFDLDEPVEILTGFRPVSKWGAHLTTAVEVAVSNSARQSAGITRQKDAERSLERRRQISFPFYAAPLDERLRFPTTAENTNRLRLHDLDGKRYLVAYGEEEGLFGEIVLVTTPSDTYPEWIILLFDVLALGLSVWGLKQPPAKKAIPIIAKIWTNATVRAVFFDLTEAASASEAASGFATLARVLYAEGLLGTLLSLFSLSWFTLLRLLSLFAPWAGLAGIVIQLAIIGKDLYELLRNKPEMKDPGVNAIANKANDQRGNIPITVNGDGVPVRVFLTGPPLRPILVETQIEGNLASTPQTLLFTPDNWKTPQEVMVSSTGPNSGFDTEGAITWFGGVAGKTVRFSINIARLIGSPDTVELEKDKEGDYIGIFDVFFQHEPATGSPATVTVTADSPYESYLEFTPAQFTLTNAENGAGMYTGSRRQTVRIKRKAGDGAPDTLGISINALVPNKKAGDGSRYFLRSSKPARVEQVSLTMVNAGAGLCFVVKNTSISESGTETDYAVIDGGFSDTYGNMQQFLPPAGQSIKLVVCTHYDRDHIGGLIELMEKRGADVQQVLFNAPPPRILGLKVLVSLADLHNLTSPQDGRNLAKLAGNKLVPAHESFTPPTGKPIKGIRLPSLVPSFIGPTDETYAANQSAPENKVFTNRASIMFYLETELDIGFRMLVTGDGYNKSPVRFDITGLTWVRDPGNPLKNVCHFLQVPHHGSRENSDAFLYRAVLTNNYLISTEFEKYGHPHPELIAVIVEANRSMGKRGFNIWITSSMPADYSFPLYRVPDEYNVYTLKNGKAGATFTVIQGIPVPQDLQDWDRVAISQQP